MFCGTKWVEEVASRAIDLWDNVVKVCNHWESLLKSKQPGSKSNLTVLEAMKYPSIKVNLHFFSYVAKVASPFLHIYQTTVPMMPFFYDDLHDVIRTPMEKIVVSSVLHESKTTSSLCKINLTKKDNLKKKPDVSFGSTTEIDNLLKKDTVTNESVKSFKKDCIRYCKRSPLKYAVVLNSSMILPLLIATNHD